MINQATNLMSLNSHIGTGDLNALEQELDKHFNKELIPEIYQVLINSFFYAIKTSKLEAINLFISKGVSVNEKNRYSIPSLHVAISSLNPGPTVVVLLERGADIFIKDDREMEPLTECARTGKIEVINILLAHLESLTSNLVIADEQFEQTVKRAIGEAEMEKNQEMKEHLNSYLLARLQKKEMEREVPFSENPKNSNKGLESNLKI